MQKAICVLSVVPVRANPSDKSEIVTQLLFGECVTVLQRVKQWAQIRCEYDGYEGWIDGKQVEEINDKYFDKISEKPSPMVMEVMHPATSDTEHLPLVMGAQLPGFDGMSFRIDKKKYVFNGMVLKEKPQPERFSEAIEKIALKYLNAPYLWGGRSPFGIDCSGFTQMVFKFLGIALPRDAYQQAEHGRTVNFIGECQLGDLAYFTNEENKIIHVGIVLEEQKIIHAAGRVRIDPLDHHGIYNQEQQKYSHTLKIIKRLI